MLLFRRGKVAAGAIMGRDLKLLLSAGFASHYYDCLLQLALSYAILSTFCFFYVKVTICQWRNYCRLWLKPFWMCPPAGIWFLLKRIKDSQAPALFPCRLPTRASHPAQVWLPPSPSVLARRDDYFNEKIFILLSKFVYTYFYLFIKLFISIYLFTFCICSLIKVFIWFYLFIIITIVNLLW